ncbi:MAG: transposase [Candidatus Cloacimonetes bacterium]|nr:transposase [Candidatus Cloacimonadota bacterium]
MKNRYKIVDEDGFYFISSTIVEWIPIFTSEKYFRILIKSMKFCQIKKELKIHYYVLMDNHFHMIVSGNNISCTISSLKRHTAFEIIDNLKQDNKYYILQQFKQQKKNYKIESNYQVWQEGFHPQLISKYEILAQKVDYIHHNPVKKGFVNEPEFWKYSSACNKDFEGNSIIKLDEIP